MELSPKDINTLREMARWFRQRNATSHRPPNAKPQVLTSTVKVKIGKTDAEITKDSTGTVSIWRTNSSGTLVDTTENIEDVELDWMHGDENVSIGKEVLIMYFADEKLWRIIGAECE